VSLLATVRIDSTMKYEVGSTLEHATKCENHLAHENMTHKWQAQPVQLTALAAYHARIMFLHCRRVLCLLSPCLKGFLLRDYPWMERETATSLSQVWVIWLVGTLGSRFTNHQCSVPSSSVLNKSVLVASGYCDQCWGNAHREMFPQMR